MKTYGRFLTKEKLKDLILQEPLIDDSPERG